jgi:hypothetical protein
MKQATLLAVFIAITSFSFSLPINSNYNSGMKLSGDTTMMKVSTVQSMLQEIIDATGLHTDFELKEANVLNIEASISHRKRYILYNPAYVTSLNNISKNRWSVVALLAHEVGHHLNGHTIRKGGSTPELELEADEFAGFILCKLGASLKQSQNVMYYIAKEKISSTHPSRSSRLLAIEKGWNRATSLQETNTAIGQ